MPSAPPFSPEPGAPRPRLLLTRPEEDCGPLAASARACGFDVAIAPLLDIAPLPAPPFTKADALLLTSARAARLAVGAWGDRLAALPVYAVGPASARAAEAEGLHLAATGDSDASAVLARAAADGHRLILHPSGSDRAPFLIPPGLRIETRPLYVAMPRPLPAALLEALRQGRFLATLLFSPRTARLFRQSILGAGIAPARLGIVVISQQAARAAGPGWGRLAVASAPRSDALLAAATRLWQGECHHG
ncbi:uroporphyrinogen-III synthase [Thermaurantiacus sp.]